MPKLSDLKNEEEFQNNLNKIATYFNKTKEQWESTALNKGIISDNDLFSMAVEAKKTDFDYGRLIDDAKRYN
ncbi:MAG: hypothetical protein HQK79_22275 [Desulfobacterales bacterium]|nr:hypothetical protein [Desulfobacterales bacterium]MBF0398745.1 hypothetical protein [Desulfobacterales bacterium]